MKSKPGPKPNGWVKVCLKLSPEAVAILSAVEPRQKSAFVDAAIKAKGATDDHG